MGGSDFHGIDETTEHVPGAIPFPKKHVELFLQHAKQVWAVPVVKRIQEMARDVLESSKEQQELLIWEEHVDIAKETAAEAKVGISFRGDGAYRTLRLSSPLVQ